MKKSETKSFDVTFGCYETKIPGDERSRVDLRASVTADGEFFAGDAISYGGVGVDGVQQIRDCFVKVEAAAKAAGAKRGRLTGIDYATLVGIEGVWANLHADLANLGVERLKARTIVDGVDITGILDQKPKDEEKAKPEKKPRRRRGRR